MKHSRLRTPEGWIMENSDERETRMRAAIVIRVLPRGGLSD